MVSVRPAHPWAHLLVATSALLVACSLDPLAAEVRCQADDHCPDDWHCSVQSGDTGQCTEGRRPTDADGDGSATGPDCDDGDPANFPGNEEACDGQDNDCSGAPDADEVDEDADGSLLCAGDCDDADADIFPGNPEVCDDQDNDCDAATDEEEDADLDGAPAVCGDDCDDDDAAIFPGNPEVCDGLDNDCDPDTNEQDDGDGDGYTPCGGDCDDTNPGRSPGNSEACDGVDTDCSGGLDPDEADVDGDGFPLCAEDCDDADPERFPGRFEECDELDSDCDGSIADEFGDFDSDGVPDCVDDDADGDGSPAEVDCDDFNPDLWPGADEICDGQDTDCSGAPGADEVDGDADGVLLCAEDCDDSDPSAFPGNPEVCDWVDNDCDGSLVDEFGDVDEDGSPDCVDPDLDGDGVTPPEDCDDADPDISPNAPELCDGLDNDCSGAPEADEVDGDGDGVMPCEGDCDDTDPNAFPGNPEECDDFDFDCDGSIADEFDDLDADGLPDCIDLDADNDGWAGTADCDDLDPTSTVVATDADCDGAITAEDCDDSDPASTLVAYDPDCDGSIDDTSAQDIDFIAIPSGTFEMGCTASQTGCNGDEFPVHTVTLSYDYWIGETEVTRAQWLALVPLDPSAHDTCGFCPAENMKWFEAAAFANEVSQAEGLDPCYLLTVCSGQLGDGLECSNVAINSPSGSVIDCEGFRLPTEAEWEYAARAGTDLYEYAGSDTIDDVAWYGGNSVSPQPVLQKQPNSWGLSEMSGNVAEWVNDWYVSNAYTSSSVTDPTGPSTPVSTSRVVRGGAFGIAANSGRCAHRGEDSVDARDMSLGFRLARTVP